MTATRPHDIFHRPEQLAALVEGFSRARIAVVGDFFLDQYFVIDPTLAEPSIETGRIAHQVIATRQSPGAAGTVVNNLSSLEAGQIHAVGVIGDDGHGYVLRKELEKRGVQTDRLIVSPYRFTPTYTKPMSLHATQEIEGERIDIINRTQTPPELEDAIVQQVEGVIGEVDAVIFLDQVVRPDVGVLTSRVRQQVARLARQHSDTIFYADSRASIAEFREAITKPNESEALRAVGMTTDGPATDDAVAKAGRQLFERTGKPVFLTRGERGILVTSEAGQVLVPAVPVEGPLDICGAGDSATAGIVLALCAGATLAQAGLVGNIVASKTVVQVGTTGTTTRKAVKETSLDWST
jgi:rfaE bifunctional protein kinase chain/domain